MEQQGCFRAEGASLTDLRAAPGRGRKALARKHLDMFENSELSQNVMNGNNGRKGGEE